jgi:hypothetical protein
MADNEIELEHPDVDDNLFYDDADTPARQAFVEVLKQSGWKVVPKSRRSSSEDEKK